MKFLKIFKRILLVILASFLTALIVFNLIIGIRYVCIKDYILSASNTFSVSKELITAVAYTESKFNGNAKSKKGAVGIMQVMPSTAKYICDSFSYKSQIDLEDKKTNIYIGTAYLKYLIDKYSDEVVVLACYNAGEGNVIKWQKNGKITVESIPFLQTANYVKKVIKIKNLILKQKYRY